jgi:branched-chain amino acid transport system substrate-binding protein
VPINAVPINSRTPQTGCSWLLVCCILLGTLLGSFGCKREDDVVRIGVIQTFSGPFARWGAQTQQAIQVFQKQRGTSVNGHKIEVLYRDDGGADPARARQLAEELVLREKVQYLAGFAFTPNALAVADLATEAQIPTLIWNAATGVVTRKSPFFVRTSYTLPQDTAPLAEWAPKNGISKVVTLVTDYAPGLDAESAFVRVFTAAGGSVLESIHVPLATTDFAPFFERVLAKQPDGLFLFGPGGPASVGMIRTWATRLKPANIQLLVTTETQEIDLPSIGDAAIGAIGSAHYLASNDRPLNSQLRQDLVAAFGPNAVPDTASVSAYDGMDLIYRAVEKLGTRPKASAVLDLWRGATVESARGPLTIDPDTRDIVQDVFLNRVEQKGDRLINVAFLTVPAVKDPWKEWNPQ